VCSGRRIQFAAQIVLPRSYLCTTHAGPFPVGQADKGVATQMQMVSLDQGRPCWRAACQEVRGPLFLASTVSAMHRKVHI